MRKVFEQAGFAPDVKYYFRDDFAVLTTVQYGLGIAVLPELIVEKFPGNYDSRMLDPEAYRTLGIGIHSIKEAGPLARPSKNSLIKEIRPRSNRERIF